MKQVVQNYRSGEMRVQDVPAPQLRPGNALVRNEYSLISAGTERALVDLAQKSLFDKARSRPDLVRKVIDKARTEGVLTAYTKAMQRLDTWSPLGYSTAGTVIAVGRDAGGLLIGGRVACAGIGYASHAEIVSVPRNLVVTIPDPVDSADAAFTTVGAIALHGVRQAEVTLGDRVLVIGLGLVGLLTVQILKAAGCVVIGMDPDPSRRALAADLGADAVAGTEAETTAACAARTGGVMADAVLLAAATSSDRPLEFAAEAARHRARIVVVGQVGMHAPRKAFYDKELSLMMSRSYGPGRYDRRYEEQGAEYPIEYVRWTENRNMSAFLDLVGAGKVRVAPLVSHRFDIEEALRAYDVITGKTSEPSLAVLLRYGANAATAQATSIPIAAASSPSVTDGSREVGIGVIGSGSFASGVLVPALAAASGARLVGICSQGGLAARSTGDRFGFAYCTSDPAVILADEAISAVVIATRPDSHADLVTRALAAGKHVFVEKPLAVTSEHLQAVVDAHATSHRQLMVGFNRRFSPHVRTIREFLAARSGPFVATYRVNAGYVPATDWQHDAEQGGGRLIGEVGHFIDVLAYLADAAPLDVFARSISADGAAAPATDNLALTIRFSDGSVGVIAYTSSGAPSFGKERLEVFADGRTAVLDDFRRIELVGGGTRRTSRAWLKQDKGHQAEVTAFLDAVRAGQPAVAAASYFQTTACTLQAAASLRSGRLEPVVVPVASSASVFAL